MVAEDFLQDPQVRRWLDGVEPAWTLLTFDSLRALRQEPSAVATAIRIANDLNADEIASSAVARNTFILLQQAIERGGLPLTATGNLSRAVVAEMRELIEWPGYDQADAFRLHKVINEPDFLPLHIVRLLAEAAKLVRTQRGKLVATPLGKSMLSDACGDRPHGCRRSAEIQCAAGTSDELVRRSAVRRRPVRHGDRPVIEAVLAQVAAQTPGLTVLRGATVTGLIAGQQRFAGVPRVARC